MKYPNLDQFIQDELDRIGRICNELCVLSPDSAPDLVENPVSLKSSSSPVASATQTVVDKRLTLTFYLYSHSVAHDLTVRKWEEVQTRQP